MPHQVALTVRAVVRRGQTDALSEFLEGLEHDGRREEVFPFESLPVHFARFVLLDDASDLKGISIPASLIFICDVDSPVEFFLTRLVVEAAEGLDAVFSHCEGYPASPNPQERIAFLRDKAILTTTAYINTVGVAVDQIRREAALREAIELHLDAIDAFGISASDIRASVQRFVASDAGLSWALKPAPKPELAWRIREQLHMIGVALVVLVLSPVLFIVAPFGLIALRLHEVSDPISTDIPDPQHLAKLQESEDLLVQNPLSAVGCVKPGPFRRLTITAVLSILSYASRHIYNRGNLAGIRTIHFARWVFLDGKRRMLFASNYDGSVESYMDDFIDKVAYGLNAAFSNGFGYPKTSWLIRGGARDEEAFKNYLRCHQVPTQLWYAAYGSLTIQNISDNAAIRAGLSGAMTDAQAEAWAKRL